MSSNPNNPSCHQQGHPGSEMVLHSKLFSSLLMALTHTPFSVALPSVWNCLVDYMRTVFTVSEIAL